MIQYELARLRAMQDAQGFFLSEACQAETRHPDSNGFATALALRALDIYARDALGSRAHDAALDALQRCRNRSSGAFRFWPAERQPAWAPRLPDDADDTALMALLLHRAGRMSLQDLRRLACHTVVCHRILEKPALSPAWIRLGTFKTWLRVDAASSVADCTVNANVSAMLAAARLRDVPGYREACDMIDAAVRWAGEDFERAVSISPFYPSPGELMLAVESALEAGAVELRPALDRMRDFPLWKAARERALQSCPVICGSAYGLVQWRSDAVGLARRVANRLRQAEGEDRMRVSLSGIDS